MLQIVTILSSAIILLLLLGYSIDNRINPGKTGEEMRMFGSKIFSWILAMFGFFIILESSSAFSLFKDDMGYSFNSKRLELGLPLIDPTWKKQETEQTPFTVTYTNPDTNSLHFKKLVEYKFLSPREEIDYYRNSKHPALSGLRIYDFERQETKFYLIVKQPGAGTSAPQVINKTDPNSFWHYFREYP